MRTLVEDRLGIPVVQVELGQNIAGATVVTKDEDGREARGVVLNTVGENENVWVRRATLAHELGHLLFDPNAQLENVRVDPYGQNEADPESHETDYVEQRANAFAVAFLAPLGAVRRMVPAPPSIESVVDVMHTYGISHTAARYHVSNSHFRQYEVPPFGAHETPRDELKAAENFALDFFPLDGTPIQRRGKFAALVTRAVEEGCISMDTASLYLQCSAPELDARFEALRAVHGDSRPPEPQHTGAAPTRLGTHHDGLSKAGERGGFEREDEFRLAATSGLKRSALQLEMTLVGS